MLLQHSKYYNLVSVNNVVILPLPRHMMSMSCIRLPLIILQIIFKIIRTLVYITFVPCEFAKISPWLKTRNSNVYKVEKHNKI